MTIDRFVHAFAGSMILASLLLAHFVSPYFLWLTAFVGANLFQSAFTDWCLLVRILKRFGMSEGNSACGLGKAKV
ncbi:MAG: DUF2892 domain-containing protein [Acidobacteria bacterium]|nr:DUF2892 domain-containing protein [Acidobacteriota bacterium]